MEKSIDFLVLQAYKDMFINEGFKDSIFSLKDKILNSLKNSFSFMKEAVKNPKFLKVLIAVVIVLIIAVIIQKKTGKDLEKIEKEAADKLKKARQKMDSVEKRTNKVVADKLREMEEEDKVISKIVSDLEKAKTSDEAVSLAKKLSDTVTGKNVANKQNTELMDQLKKAKEFEKEVKKKMTDFSDFDDIIKVTDRGNLLDKFKKAVNIDGKIKVLEDELNL